MSLYPTTPQKRFIKHCKSLVRLSRQCTAVTSPSHSTRLSHPSPVAPRYGTCSLVQSFVKKEPSTMFPVRRLARDFKAKDSRECRHNSAGDSCSPPAPRAMGLATQAGRQGADTGGKLLQLGGSQLLAPGIRKIGHIPL